MGNEYAELVRELFEKRETPPLCFVHSCGCQQNVNDGEKILGILCSLGCGVTDTPDNADIIILNTCAVRENAELKAYGLIGSYKHLKENNPSLIIGVCGCMAEEKATAEKIKASYKYVDMVFGTFALKELPRLLYQVLTERGLKTDLSHPDGECLEGVPCVRRESFRAGVSVMYGCNNFCTYCIVPYVRGRERSRKSQNIIDEVKSLVNNGCREIMLLGQNVNSYGRGLDEKTDFPELLHRIDNIDGDFRIRFMSPHPKDATKEFFDVIAESSKICRSVHMPLQSGSSRILRLMNRGYTAEKYLEQICYARKIMPGLSITTDIIVGFPGETREDFDRTLDIMRFVKFDNIFSFIYSKRTGTKAALMDDPVSPEEKSGRMKELLELQRNICTENYKRFIGREMTVLFDGVYKNGLISGKSDEFINVLVNGSSSVIGKMSKVRISKAHNWAVEGEITGDIF